MITLNGTSARSGTAIAAAAVVTSKLGIGGLSPDILQQGVDALKRQLPPHELPEVVIVCDNLAVGAGTKIPGVNTIGFAAESSEIPGHLTLDVPTVVGVGNLLKSVTQGEIVIIDGDRGVVRIDPDSNTIAAYQQEVEKSRHRPVFIESQHLPAKTQAGETVVVYARAASSTELAQAVEEGADGIVAEQFELQENDSGGLVTSATSKFYETALTACLGKPVAFPASFADKELVRAATRLASPGQVRILFPMSHFETLANKMREVIQTAADDALNRQMEQVEIILGALAGPESSAAATVTGIRFALVDVRRVDPTEVSKSVSRWTGAEETVIFDVADALELLESAVRAGARGVVTVPGRVATFKQAIRAIGLEEVE